MLRLLVLTLALGLGAIPTAAQNQNVKFMTARQFVDAIRTEKYYAKWMARGLADGFDWYNEAMNPGVRLYCLPPGLALNVYNYAQMVDRYVKDRPTEAALPVGVVILRSLQRTFPCPWS